MSYKVIQGNNIDILKTYPDNHFDSIVTDPPYGIDFLGKSWDANTGALETYQECLRVLKPGGHILAFSAARTYHHLAITLEQAGFEIRDQIMWIYSSGFPKSQDVGKSIERNEKKDGSEWKGWGTALKPAHEPICMARKPIKQSIAKNAQQWGTGALNIDATRVPYDGSPLGNPNTAAGTRQQKGDFGNGMLSSQPAEWHGQGRFPSNVIGEIPDYQKYFYCPKVSRKERHAGFELPAPMFGGVQGCYDENGERFAVGFDARAQNKILSIGSTHPDDIKKHPLWDPSIGGDAQRLKAKILANTPEHLKGNHHPTVKPVELMKYLIKLVTPPGGRVLDPFNGSGSTGMAAVELGHEYIGCELDPKYVEISLRRIAAWTKEDMLPREWFK